MDLRRINARARFGQRLNSAPSAHRPSWPTATGEYISATPVATAVAGLDKEAQAKITADVRDALAAYRVGDGLVAPIEAHVAIGHC
jgi:hypothetical protein